MTDTVTHLTDASTDSQYEIQKFTYKHFRELRAIIKEILHNDELKQAGQEFFTQGQSVENARAAYKETVNEFGEDSEEARQAGDRLVARMNGANMMQAHLLWMIVETAADEESVAGRLDRFLASLIGQDLGDLEEEEADWWPEAVGALCESKSLHGFLLSFSKLPTRARDAFSIFSAKPTDGQSET